MSVTETSLLQSLLAKLAGQQVSDLHLRAGSPPVVRRDGELEVMADEAMVTPELLVAALEMFLSEPQRSVLEHERQVTTGYTFANRMRFRVSVFYQKGLPEVTLRFIPTAIKTMAELSLPSALQRAVESASHGLVVVAGPYGAGRSTTLAATLQAINHTKTKHIVTIEQPIEYVLVGEKSLLDQREVGSDVLSWEEAVASLPTEDIDVVGLGRLPSPKVAEQVINLALAGKLVIAVLEAESATKAVEQLVASVLPEQQPALRGRLADALLLVVMQQLVPRVGGGRVLVSEVLVATPAVKAVISDGKFLQLPNLLLTRDEGMESFDRALAQLVKTGEVMQEVALGYAHDREALQSLIRH